MTGLGFCVAHISSPSLFSSHVLHHRCCLDYNTFNQKVVFTTLLFLTFSPLTLRMSKNMLRFLRNLKHTLLGLAVCLVLNESLTFAAWQTNI